MEGRQKNMTISCQNVTVTGTGHPNIFLNQTEIDIIKANVAANIEPWKSAYNGTLTKSMISLANSALSVPLQDVMNGKLNPATNDSHDYYAEAVYCGWPNLCPNGQQPSGTARCCDGYPNPDADRTDQIAAENLKRAIRKVALGYMFTGNSTYANKTQQFIYQWCINPSTRVNPRYTPWPSGMINDSMTFLPRVHQAVVLGAAAIWNYPSFQQYKTSFKNWLIQMIDATTWDTNGQTNWGIQRDAFLIIAGALLYYDSDTRTRGLSIINSVIDRFKARCFNSFTIGSNTYEAMIDTNGSLPHERNRTNGLMYSTFGQLGLVVIAEVALHYGTDLYHYTQNNRSLEKALDFQATYILNPSQWPYKQKDAYAGSNVAIYEVAYTRYDRKSLYKDVITRFSRPMDEYNIMGATTLTHGSAFV